MSDDERKVLNDEIYAMICELIRGVPFPEQELKICV